MRLATIQVGGEPRAAAWTRGLYVDLHATDAALPASVRQLLDGGKAALEAAARAAQSAKAVTHSPAAVKLRAPILDPRKIICLGLNYRDHAAESGAPIPKEPILFSK